MVGRLLSQWGVFWGFTGVLILIVGAVCLPLLQNEAAQEPTGLAVPVAVDVTLQRQPELKSSGRLSSGVGVESIPPAAEHEGTAPTPPDSLTAFEQEADLQATYSRAISAEDLASSSPTVATPAVPTSVADAAATLVAVPGAESNKVSGESQQTHADQIALGKQLFVHPWQPHDKLAGRGDGLGPLYNGRSCVECHSQGGIGGAGSNEHSIHAFEILPSKAGDEVRAGVIHAFATKPHVAETIESLDQHFRPGKVVAGLRRPGSKELTNKVDLDATRLVWVNSPALWGLGRIDQLSDEQLRQTAPATAEKPTDRTAGGVRGRYRIHSDGRIGRFGWKGQFATLKEFVAGACANELGLSNPQARQLIPGEFRPDLEARDDLDSGQVEAMVRFVATLPEPRQVLPRDPQQLALIKNGEALIGAIGCTSCHTRDVGDLKNVYGDFRLHTVEDTVKVSDAYYHQDFQLEVEPPSDYPRLSEWRTPALWGVAETAPYWHDGSARTLEAAIKRHAAEALPVTKAYLHLSREDQQSILAFLSTLRAPAEVNDSIADPARTR